jgi:hypothetical protein
VIKEYPEDPMEAFRLYNQGLDASLRVSIEMGGLLNEHHGAGLHMGCLLKETYGEQYEFARILKRMAGPNDIMNPGKLGEESVAAGHTPLTVQEVGTLKEFYPAWGVTLPQGVEVLHTSDVLDRMLSSGTIKLNARGKDGTMSHHDPCMLGRKMGAYDAPSMCSKP